MNTLSELLSSRVKAEIFRLLFGADASELHVREIARRANLNDATVRQELKKLINLGLIAARPDGNRTCYRARPEHPLYSEIRGMVLKTSGLAEVVRESLRGSDVRVAFVFGSMASGEGKAGSDVDLMVLGPLTLRELTKRLMGAAARLGREINPHVLSIGEYSRRTRARDRFLTSVLKGPKLFVVGDDHELEGLGR